MKKVCWPVFGGLACRSSRGLRRRLKALSAGRVGSQRPAALAIDVVVAERERPAHCAPVLAAPVALFC